MKAFVINGPHNSEAKTVDDPTLGFGEIVVQVERCGICGTDTHIYQGDFLSQYPLIPGHEFSGVVKEVGEGECNISVGDRVAVDPSLFCGKCEFCLSGRGNHCVSWGAIGDTVNGAMAEYVKVPVENVFHLPDNLSFAQGAFLEPIACVVHGMNQLQLSVGQSVLLFGAGSMGQLLVQALSHAGAGELVVVDISKQKLELAGHFGATRGILSNELDVNLSHRRGHQGFDVVIDATGLPSVIQGEFSYLAPKGTFMQFGVAPVDATIAIRPFDIYHNDWKLIGSMAINHTYQSALNWMKAGRFDVNPLISDTIALDDLPEFFKNGKHKDTMKVQVSME